MKKFEKNDILRNVLVTNPKARFFCYNGKIYYNGSTDGDLNLKNFLQYKEAEVLPTIENAITLEDGTFLLNEDGTYILLEE